MSNLPRHTWIGYDPRPAEMIGFMVAHASARRHLVGPMPFNGLVLTDLQKSGLYTRETERWMGTRTDRAGKKHSASEPSLWDKISDAPMSTEFSISRFLIPHLMREMTKAGRPIGWALFMEPDMLVRGSLDPLFAYSSENQKYAVMCVKHNYKPSTETKMDGQPQTAYARKNWTSFIMFNGDHPSNRRLTPDVVNSWTGRDLHGLKWLEDSEIGELPPQCNWLVREQEEPENVKVVHYTLGNPGMVGFENEPYADEWRAYRDGLAGSPRIVSAA